MYMTESNKYFIMMLHLITKGKNFNWLRLREQNRGKAVIKGLVDCVFQRWLQRQLSCMLSRKLPFSPQDVQSSSSPLKSGWVCDLLAISNEVGIMQRDFWGKVLKRDAASAFLAGIISLKAFRHLVSSPTASRLPHSEEAQISLY